MPRSWRPRRQQVAPDVAAEEAGDEVDRAVDDEEPGEEEMPAPAGGEILVARQRQPGREAARLRLAVGAGGQAEEAGGVEGRRRRSCVSPIGSPSAPMARGHAQHRVGEVGRLAEIERRMGVEDLQPAHHQDEDAEHVDPVGDAGEHRVPVDQETARPHPHFCDRNGQLPLRDAMNFRMTQTSTDGCAGRFRPSNQFSITGVGRGRDGGRRGRAAPLPKPLRGFDLPSRGRLGACWAQILHCRRFNALRCVRL